MTVGMKTSPNVNLVEYLRTKECSGVCECFEAGVRERDQMGRGSASVMQKRVLGSVAPALCIWHSPNPARQADG